MSVFGFPSAQNTAPFHPRYIGLYHYSAYWNSWDKILDVSNRVWTVQKVDIQGNPIGPVRMHRTPMHANLFADQPFTARSVQAMLDL